MSSLSQHTACNQVEAMKYDNTYWIHHGEYVTLGTRRHHTMPRMGTFWLQNIHPFPTRLRAMNSPLLPAKVCSNVQR